MIRTIVLIAILSFVLSGCKNDSNVQKDVTSIRLERTYSFGEIRSWLLVKNGDGWDQMIDKVMDETQVNDVTSLRVFIGMQYRAKSGSPEDTAQLEKLERKNSPMVKFGNYSDKLILFGKGGQKYQFNWAYQYSGRRIPELKGFVMENGILSISQSPIVE